MVNTANKIIHEAKKVHPNIIRIICTEKIAALSPPDSHLKVGGAVDIGKCSLSLCHYSPSCLCVQIPLRLSFWCGYLSGIYGIPHSNLFLIDIINLKIYIHVLLCISEFSTGN